MQRPGKGVAHLVPAALPAPDRHASPPAPPCRPRTAIASAPTEPKQTWIIIAAACRAAANIYLICLDSCSFLNEPVHLPPLSYLLPCLYTTGPRPVLSLASPPLQLGQCLLPLSVRQLPCKRSVTNLCSPCTHCARRARTVAVNFTLWRRCWMHREQRGMAFFLWKSPQQQEAVSSAAENTQLRARSGERNRRDGRD